DLWRSLCTYENAAPIQGVTIEQLKGPRANLRIKQLFPREAYPAGAPVMDHRGKAQAGLTSTNLAPWCLLGANPALDANAVQAYVTEDGLARCPDSVTASVPWTDEEMIRWTLHGAVNAGRVVFQYLDDLTHGVTKPRPDYTRCDQLEPATSP
ncbi:MAG TPA: hypothetical protein VI299_02850, partial [Polyangiales bacterium]